MPGATPSSSGTVAEDPRQAGPGGAGHGPRAGHIEVLEVMSDLLSGVGEGSPPDAFFSSLCEAICRLASMKRAVLVRYDSVRRRVRAVGAHGTRLTDLTALLHHGNHLDATFTGGTPLTSLTISGP